MCSGITTQNRKEKRKDFTWYLIGNEKGEREFAGMAAVFRNNTHKYIKYVIPCSQRMMEIQVEGSVPITILNIYAPQAGRLQEEKD